MKTTTRFWIALGVLALLSPLGMLVPALFKAGGAFGEWDAGAIAQRVGYAPRELARAGARWQAPMPDYAFKGWEAKDMAHLGAAYLVSAVVGIVLIAALAWLTGRLLTKKSDFVAHSLRSALAFLKEAVFAEETAALPGLLQGIDPRMKLVTVLLLLSVTLFTRSLAVLGMLYLLGLLLAVASDTLPGAPNGGGSLMVLPLLIEQPMDRLPLVRLDRSCIGSLLRWVFLVDECRRRGGELLGGNGQRVLTAGADGPVHRPLCPGDPREVLHHYRPRPAPRTCPWPAPVEVGRAFWSAGSVGPLS